MRGIGLMALCGVLLVAVGISFAASEELDELCIPMQVLVLEPLSGATQHRSSVQFPHATHFNYACQRCHHDWNGKTEVQTCTTSGCHDQAKTPKADAMKEPSDAIAVKYYKKAYHKLCIGCHKDIKQKNTALEFSKKTLTVTLAKTGPTGCIQCHPKQDE
ncbi:MAG: cytochrome c3 family protein [Pseudomonadota bacterium]